MRITVTNHCIEKIKTRKGKETDKQALFFAINVFEIMMKTRQYQGTECILKRAKYGRESIYHAATGYKFVFMRNPDSNFTVITFAIHTPLDCEIGKLIKRLCKLPGDERILGDKHGSVNFE